MGMKAFRNSGLKLEQRSEARWLDGRIGRRYVTLQPAAILRPDPLQLFSNRFRAVIRIFNPESSWRR